MMIRKTIIITVMLTCYCIFCTAQQWQNNYEFGLSGGLFLYQGDLTPRTEGAIETPRFGVNLYASRILGNSFSIRANLTIGSLHADDAVYEKPEWRQQRNFMFSTPIIEPSAQIVWDVLGKNRMRTGFVPYVYGGVGVSFLNISRDYSRFNTEAFSSEPNVSEGLQRDIERGRPGALFVLPAGVGIKYWLTRNIAINAEASYRFSFSDYLDGFSQAASPTKRDYYYVHSIGIVFRPGGKTYLDCPVF
jgi:hypothetical protein